MPSITYRDLTSLDDFATVVDLELEIWGPGYSEPVPLPILAVTVKRGGILIGAFEGDRMIGFVYSLAGLHGGRPMQWSHMAGVVSAFRSAGIGYRLKMLQRDRALQMGLDLIEWTYDPMQAMNAHLNFSKLGVVAGEYEENAYGASQSPLHRGNPTDRFIVEWRIREPHVVRRLAVPGIPLRTHEMAGVRHANRASPAGEWHESSAIDLAVEDRRVIVEIPMGFTDMLANAPDLALAWRMDTRRLFTTYFARGFRAVDFFLDRSGRKGAYLLVRKDD
jgi:predicted GNAT superfamily acetyltransferase